MTTYANGALEATAQVIARSMGRSITLGEPDTWQFSTEPGVLWTQPKEGRYRYEEPRYQPARDDSFLDRYVVVDVIIRAPGSERALLELSDAFLRAMDAVLGAQPHGWRIQGNSSGGGSNPDEGVWVEAMRVLIRYDVIREFFKQGQPLAVVTTNEVTGMGGTAESGMFVEGPAQGENSEVVS
ncbi:MAG: hypothetical protein IPM54_25030 [Polyangiaceae bacterium]|nr:hypothetical protein [Polyangiaceae bacterium]